MTALIRAMGCMATATARNYHFASKNARALLSSWPKQKEIDMTRHLVTASFYWPYAADVWVFVVCLVVLIALVLVASD